MQEFYVLVNAVFISRGLHIMLYMANIHTVVVLEQNKEYSTDPISVSLAFCCIVILSQEKEQ